jgi:uncharacterized membrane protein YkvA (DUF1232 family)
VCSPIQLLPSFIPVIGQLDDLFVIWISNRIIQRLVHKEIYRECREKVEGLWFTPDDDRVLARTPVGEV